MTTQEIQSIAHCLMKRVTPRDAEEGVALAQLAQKLVSHFAPKATQPQDSPVVLSEKDD